ncbi:5-oxoprolinase subunit PxpB [Hymenobacter elongatus]|uniref:5-oxoprolinase subunit PxpB n=1 Tax=Hymenobacter elongatus TaxID=877208 RepID=A0A4Z0PQW4_9BACT|nr:5-oxoprolinase subunit PxpB [Hymenobacter elongatus]TGE18982.1 5-oxoprolinase subunit PxpB [Hymenobacter elongatus]
MSNPIQLYPLGDAAIVLKFGDTIALPTHHAIRAVCAHLDEHPVPGLVEYVPAFTTLTLYYDPWHFSAHGRLDPYAGVTAAVRQLLAHIQNAAPRHAPRLLKIPVCYAPEFGPDLEVVASHSHLLAEEVIARHSGAEYVVYMIGFAPGFPYLGGMDARIAAPRKDQPRTLVPAGAVGIAGTQTGIYSIPTPGGWQLIGRTPLRLFDPHRAQPSLLQAGDQLRFVPITEREFGQHQRHES